MCDQLLGRLKTIDKFGPPKDMDQTFRTLIYASVRLEVDELMEVRRQLGKLLGKQFLIAAETDTGAVNKVVSSNSSHSLQFSNLVVAIHADSLVYIVILKIPFGCR
jgi:hypothetical protein